MANKRRKPSGLAPIEDNVIEKDMSEFDFSTIGENDSKVGTDNIESYLKPENEDKNTYTQKDAEIAVLNEKIESLTKENDKLIQDNKELLEKIETLIKDKENNDNEKILSENKHLKEDNDKFQNMNDELILKNSELEFEIARLTESIKMVQAQVDSQLHTYTQPGYSEVASSKNNKTRFDNKDRVPKYIKSSFVKSQNGYQDWR